LIQTIHFESDDFAGIVIDLLSSEVVYCFVSLSQCHSEEAILHRTFALLVFGVVVLVMTILVSAATKYALDISLAIKSCSNNPVKAILPS
jgi:hypothetical protein